MSTNTREAQEMLRLFKCVIDTGTDVLTAFAKCKLLPTYNGNFERFLDDKKHELFHIFQSKKLLCCECPPAGYNIRRTSHMDNWIFRKIYDDSGNENKAHIVRTLGKLMQVCLHKYKSRSIGIHELDISVTSFLLRNLLTLSQIETTSLDTITTYRSKICHAYSTKCYSLSFLNTAWSDLENALVDLTDPSYKGVIQKQIQYLRKVDLEKEEITELLKNVEEVNTGVEEVRKLLLLNNNAIGKCEENLKTKVVEESRVMQQCLINESSSMKQAQKVVLKEVISSKAGSKERGDKILEQIGILNTNQASSNLEMSEQLKKIGEECLVLWQLATPENWNAVEVEEILTKFEDKFKDLPMKIKFVRKGSLVIMTTVSAEVLKNSTAFQSAVKVFLTRMVEVCNIDSTIKCNVGVTLHILKNDELNVTYRLPDTTLEDKSVQTEDTDYEHQMRMEKHWHQDDNFDLAFLNSDNQREIEWVQNISSILKEKYDMKSAIPSKDYLYGFPFKYTLLQYLNKFQAVILIVTAETYAQCKRYVDHGKSFIIVEIDYISEIRREFWKFPYINCTTCKHLWFPRLINNLTTELPDHSRKLIENFKDEQEVHCEKCMSSSKTAVYHTVGITKYGDYRTQSFVTFCGSRTDEPWILNFLNQKTQFMKPYEMVRWYKSLDGIFRGELSSTLYVCVSPNLQKCPKIGKAVNVFVKDKTKMVFVLKIAKADTPRFIGHLPICIDATTMDQRELAHTLFCPTGENLDSPMVSPQREDLHSSAGSIQSEDRQSSDASCVSCEIFDFHDDEMESLKKSNVRIRKEKSWLPDNSVDEIKIMKKSNVRLEKGIFGRPDDFVDENKSLKKLIASSKTPRPR